MATQIVELTGDEARLLRSIEKVIATEERHRQKLEQTEASGRQAGDGIGAAMVSAEAIVAKEMNSIVRELRTMGPEGKKAAANLESHLRDTGKDGKKSIAQITSELRRLDPAAAAAATAIETDLVGANEAAATSAKQTFGSGAVKQLAQYAAGFATVTAAIDVVKQAFTFMAEERAKALESLQSQADPEQRLLQVSRDSADFAGLVETSDRLAVDYGVDRDASRELTFSARSEGFEGALDFIGSNASVIPVGSQATVAGQIPGLFTNETITPQQAINATLAAAESSRLDFQQIARSLPSAAEGGAIAGASFTETTGALSVLAGRFKSGDTAADRLKAFTTKVGLDESTKGLGIVAAVEKLQALSEADRKDYLKDGQELNAAYLILTEELDAIKDRIGTIDQAVASTGTDQSPTAIKRAIAAGNNRVSSRKAVASAENRLEIERENNQAFVEADRTVAVSDTLANLDRNNSNGIARLAAKGASTLSNFLGDDAETSRLTTEVAAEIFGGDTSAPGTINTGPAAYRRNPQVDELLAAMRGVQTNTSPGPPDPSKAQRAAAAEALQ